MEIVRVAGLPSRALRQLRFGNFVQQRREPIKTAMNSNSCSVRSSRSSAFFLLLASTAAIGSDAPAGISVLGHALHRVGPIGAQGWGEVDVDQDGQGDLVTSGNGPASLILVYGRAHGSSALALKQSLILPPLAIDALATASHGDTRVVSIGPDRVARRYGGWPLAEIGAFEVAHVTRIARIGDIDGDGELELLCAGEGTLSAYSLPSGTPEWSMKVQAADLALATLDQDPALEIIVAGGDSAPGLVIDGATRMLDWSRPEGFGTYVATGRLLESGGQGFVGARDWDSLSGFTTAPYGLSWSMPNFDTDAVAAGDTDGDGQDELAVGDGQWGSVRVYDTPDRRMLYEMHNPGNGVDALGLLDFDADGRDEVWFTARGEGSTNTEENFGAVIMDPASALPRLMVENYRQGATASLLADLDQEGTLEWVVGTSNPSAYKGLLRILNAATQTEVWRAPYEIGNGFAPFQTGYRSLHASQLDGDTALELIAVGAKPFDEWRILIVDGRTREVEHQIPTPIGRWPHTVSASRLVQHVPGGPAELLVAIHQYNAPENVRLEVYALPLGNLLWRSETVAGPYDEGLSLDVGQLDSDPAAEYLLAFTGGLTAFDASSGVREWTLSRPTAGALILSDPLAPVVLSFTREGQVVLIDPVSGLVTGEFTLPAPVEKFARLPNVDDKLLAIAGERLLLVDRQGEVLASSGWIGSEPGVGDNLSVSSSQGGWLISVGRSFTTFQLRLTDPAFIFADNFD